MTDNQNMNDPLDMSLLELFNGVALVIDDCIDKKNINNEKEDEIHRILEQLSELHIPYVTETALPSQEKQKHYTGISFVILDWKLLQTYHDKNVLNPETLNDFMEKDNISFIKEMNARCYCPIFIFTNEGSEYIANKLRDDGIQCDEKSNVFIKQKDELTGNNSVVQAIIGWIKSNPSMYVLKKWDIEYQKAKSRLFEGFQNYSPNWPSILWDTFHEDGENESLGIRELLSNNLYSRMKPFSFEKRIIKGCYPSVNEDEKCEDEKYKDEIRSILEAERFITKSLLDNDDIGTGDVFLDDRKPQKPLYYLNIRPQCDIARGKNPDLYCLKGKIGKDLEVSHGQFLEKICNAIVPFLHNGQTIEFQFRDIEIIKWEDIKNIRIGRLLPPFITRIQQRYALYLQRQGLPRIPDILLPPPKKSKE